MVRVSHDIMKAVSVDGGGLEEGLHSVTYGSWSMLLRCVRMVDSVDS